MSVRILQGDCREVLATLPDASVQCCVTSPPYYGLRDYGVAGQIGLEQTPAEYVEQMVAVFRELRRVLRDDGTVWLNLGDSYCSTAPGTMGDKLNQRGILAGVSDRRAEAARKPRPETPVGPKPKDLLGIPWRVAFALQADGWWLRSDIIWAKPNPMPESVTDRPTSAHEHVFLLTKRERYFYDQDAIREPATGRAGERAMFIRTDEPRHGTRKTYEQDGLVGSNARNVWTIATAPYAEAHFATFPPELAERCIKAGSRKGNTVLDPFGGAGTTALVADRLGRNAILIELNQQYCDLARNRLTKDAGLFAEVAA